MRPMTEQGRTGHKYRHDRDRNRDGEDQRMILVHLMTFGKPDTLAHAIPLLLWVQTAESEEMTCRDSCAAPSVRSISWEVCAAETKAASNCDGAKNMPRSSISRKNLAYLFVSERLASL